ncbi:hypothetical protein [Motiliproteus sediminis]|uniref:hypothetical protein n=1 Tax=Motiliproteus sediminis TaxID=1468178 RepID=UPI001AEFDF6C|nr:hypothetical protein [Motiliproteus sediminis]
MPVAYQIDTHQRLVCISATGTVTVAELLALFDAIRGDTDFTPDCSLFSDYRGIRPLDLDVDGIDALAQNAVDIEPHRCRIILVDNTLNYGIGRMYQSHMEIYAKTPALITSSLTTVRDELTRVGIDYNRVCQMIGSSSLPNTR